MIQHLFTLHAHGHPVEEHLALSIGNAIAEYAASAGAVAHANDVRSQLTSAVWRDGKWLGYYRATFGIEIHSVDEVETPACFEPLPCPQVASVLPRLKWGACDPAAQQVAFMALESRARSLGLEAEEHRSVGHDELADILMGHQAACVAALELLKGVGR